MDADMQSNLQKFNNKEGHQLLAYIQSDKFGSQGGESNQLMARIQEFIDKLDAENQAIESENSKLVVYND